MGTEKSTRQKEGANTLDGTKLSKEDQELLVRYIVNREIGMFIAEEILKLFSKEIEKGKKGKL